MYALQSPKRRTYAALRKHSSNGGGGASNSNDNNNSKRVWSAGRKMRGPVLEDEGSTAANTPDLVGGGGGGAGGGGGGARRSVTSPTASRDPRRGIRSSYTSSTGGIEGFLSPRAWPQPASSPSHISAIAQQRNATVPQSLTEQHHHQQQEQPPPIIIRRRPVPSTSTVAWGASISSASDLLADDGVTPLPLCTPVRGAGGMLVSSPHGLGIILHPGYAAIAGSSPFGEEEERN